MNYYGRNDIPLGEFLRRYCFRDGYTCQGCGVDMVHHQRHFVHGNMELRVSMQELESTIPDCDSGFYTWLTCMECKEVKSLSLTPCLLNLSLSLLLTASPHPQSTPLVNMSEDSLCLSFAKFLELKFYGSSYTMCCHGDKPTTCTHNLHSQYTQYFYTHKRVAIFE